MSSSARTAIMTLSSSSLRERGWRDVAALSAEISWGDTILRESFGDGDPWGGKGCTVDCELVAADDDDDEDEPCAGDGSQRAAKESLFEAGADMGQKRRESERKRTATATGDIDTFTCLFYFLFG